MQDETANDVDVVKKTTSEEVDALADYPIMMLFKRLLGNENKQNTVLTNVQIIDLLEKEFHIKTENLHELEMDIYLSIMKKFLKDWPEWDEFDRVINEIKQKKSQAGTQIMLLRKYKQLKIYLSIMLDMARPRAKDKVKEIEEEFKRVQKNVKSVDEDLSDVVLEINCSRSQLNTLFFNHPHPEQNYSIFNTNEAGPSKICFEIPDYNAIMNWWNVSIIFRVNNLYFSRSTIHEITHLLVNKKLKKKRKPLKIFPGCQEKPFMKHNMTGTHFNKQQLVELLRDIYMKYKETEYKPVLEDIYSIIDKDLTGLPTNLQDMVSYKKSFSKYPYIRRLYTDVPEAENDKEAMNYDLHLREEIVPMYQYDITKVEPIVSPVITTTDLRGILFECKSCMLKFSGTSMLEQLKQHILQNHFNEPNWLCQKCKNSFTTVFLAKNRWSHECAVKA